MRLVRSVEKCCGVSPATIVIVVNSLGSCRHLSLIGRSLDVVHVGHVRGTWSRVAILLVLHLLLLLLLLLVQLRVLLILKLASSLGVSLEDH